MPLTYICGFQASNQQPSKKSVLSIKQVEQIDFYNSDHQKKGKENIGTESSRRATRMFYSKLLNDLKKLKNSPDGEGDSQN